MSRSATSEREFEFRDADFRFISTRVHQQTGIVLADHKKDMVYARIARRLRSLGLTSFADYCALLESESGDAELGNFVNAVTTNLTSFFREPHHFDFLKADVLKPAVSNPPPSKRLRLWSAACSSGAEPYSMAMMCADAIPDFPRWDIKILATDIDTGMLAEAAAGEYSEEDFEPVPTALHNRYTSFDKASGKFKIADSIRQLITFKQLNLIEEWPLKGLFDAVFCRNVVIYFDKDTQKLLFEKIAQRMHLNAPLYIGHSETLHGISPRFKLTEKTAYRKVA